MGANVAKDLAREALLYDELGHRREARLLLIHGARVCPEAREIKRVAAKLGRTTNGKLERVEQVGCTLMDWLYLPTVIAGSIGAALLIGNIILV
jgi:hypothetical protein